MHRLLKWMQREWKRFWAEGIHVVIAIVLGVALVLYKRVPPIWHEILITLCAVFLIHVADYYLLTRRQMVTIQVAVNDCMCKGNSLLRAASSFTMRARTTWPRRAAPCP